MLVDNPLQPSYFSSSSSSAFQDFSNDLSDYLNPELFGASVSQSSAASSSSRASSPHSPSQSLLATPPQSSVPSFPDINDISYGSGAGFSFNSSTSFFNLLDDEMKLIDPSTSLTASSAPFDFFGTLSGGGGPGPSLSGSSPASEANSSSSSSSAPELGIDPQLVGTPSVIEEEESPMEAEEPALEKEIGQEKLTLTIAPVKVGGHGKSRKGTVQSGGITKKVASPATSVTSTSTAAAAAKDKENVKKLSAKDDDDDDLPIDWRPPPEVFAKMTSKEKRQLRNKISARNFRVRRKEYISTLEMDIAERDRLLQAIRSELGSTQSENVALRQEIAALKKALLEGRSGTLKQEDIPQLNLPPPAPLPPLNVSSPSASAPASSPLVTPNTQKDLPSTAGSTSPRLGAFWGGVGGMGIGGGITPVHTVLMPEPSSFMQKQGSVRAALQENINPALNSNPGPGTPPVGKGGITGGFDGFVDMNPFTMKTLDAYRMQLWTKMASQQAHSHHPRSPTPPPLIGSPSMFTQQLPGSPSPSPPLHGLALQLRQLHFAPSSKANVPIPPTPTPTLSALLAGKHSSPSLSSLPPSLSKKENQFAKEKEHAMIAAYASQTLFGKLTGAFWNAFTDSSSSSTSSHSWDADKVRKVLEGKAVVKIVDVEPTVKKEMPLPKLGSSLPLTRKAEKCEDCSISSILEEGIRSLTLGKK